VSVQKGYKSDTGMVPMRSLMCCSISCYVLHVIADYSGGAGQLTMREGDIVEVLKERSADWVDAELNGKKGLAPRSYLQPVMAHTITNVFSSTQHGVSVLKAGDRVTLLMMQPHDGMVLVRSPSGHCGLVSESALDLGPYEEMCRKVGGKHQSFIRPGGLSPQTASHSTQKRSPAPTDDTDEVDYSSWDVVGVGQHTDEENPYDIRTIMDLVGKGSGKGNVVTADEEEDENPYDIRTIADLIGHSPSSGRKSVDEPAYASLADLHNQRSPTIQVEEENPYDMRTVPTRLSALQSTQSVKMLAQQITDRSNVEDVPRASIAPRSRGNVKLMSQKFGTAAGSKHQQAENVHSDTLVKAKRFAMQDRKSKKHSAAVGVSAMIAHQKSVMNPKSKPGNRRRGSASTLL